MAKAKAKSKPCAKEKCKGKGKGKAKAVEKAKGLEEAQRWPCKGWLAGKQRHENARSKCSNKCPDQQWKKIQRSLNSKRSWQASCWTRTWTMAQTLIHWHCQQSLVSMLPVQESPPPHWSLVPILPVHTLVNPVSMLPVHTLCLVVPGSHTRKQQCKHSHPMGPCRIQYPGQGTVEWHRPRPRADQPLRRSLMMLHIVARHRNVLSASMVHT